MTQTDELREQIEDALREAHRRGRRSGQTQDTAPYTLCDLTNDIMALMEQVRADERERLAKRAESYFWPRMESCAQAREFFAAFLRFQGGKP